MNELRLLSGNHPEHGALHGTFARALRVAIQCAEKERQVSARDELIRELRQLGQEHPYDAEIRQWIESPADSPTSA